MIKHQHTQSSTWWYICNLWSITTVVRRKHILYRPRFLTILSSRIAWWCSYGFYTVVSSAMFQSSFLILLSSCCLSNSTSSLIWSCCFLSLWYCSHVNHNNVLIVQIVCPYAVSSLFIRLCPEDMVNLSLTHSPHVFTNMSSRVNVYVLIILSSFWLKQCPYREKYLSLCCCPHWHQNNLLMSE